MHTYTIFFNTASQLVVKAASSLIYSLVPPRITLELSKKNSSLVYIYWEKNTTQRIFFKTAAGITVFDTPP